MSQKVYFVPFTLPIVSGKVSVLATSAAEAKKKASELDMGWDKENLTGYDGIFNDGSPTFEDLNVEEGTVTFGEPEETEEDPAEHPDHEEEEESED